MVRILVLVSILCMSLFVSVQSQARVDILPHIVVIEGRERSGEVIVLNFSEKVNEFDLQVIHYRQDENGVYEVLDEPLSPLFDPREILRMSPKKFQLSGAGRQKVRLSLRKPSDLPEAEYRFHIVATGHEPQKEKKNDENVAVSMAINVGVAIPVIIRHGDLSVIGKVKDFELVESSKTESKKPELKFTATREGNASTLGRVDVAWAPDGGDYEDIGFITNFNLFTEIDKRYGTIPLEKMPRGGSIRVLYTDIQTEEVYDEVIFDL